MRVLITGVRGLIGRALEARLTSAGHSVTGLSRSPGRGDIGWDVNAGQMEAGRLEGFDAVVHLAGESIAAGRWTATKKAAIMDTRVRGTRLLATTLAGLDRPPRILIGASAIGWYGHRPGETLDEGSATGTGFLAEVCRQWEAAAEPARAAGIRVLHARFGVVLSPHGGALKPLLKIARLGLAGPVGSGRQIWSWIALEDVANGVAHLMGTEDVTGPVNFTAPNPVSQGEFASTLGRVLGRPAFMPLPAFAARIVLGEMANELLLPDQHVVPSKLNDSGYVFAQPNLEQALRTLLGKRPART